MSLKLKNMKIPKRFKLFGTTYSIIFNNNRLNDKNRYGECNFSTCEITLSDVDGVQKLSEDRILDTYYHEKIHAILDTMGENELSMNEKFVDVFAKLLRQSDETAEY